MPLTASPRLLSPLRPRHWLASRAVGAQTIRAEVACAMGKQAEAEAYGVHKACCGGSTFLTLVLALMLAAAVFALAVVLGFAALVVVPAAVAAVVISLS